MRLFLLVILDKVCFGVILYNNFLALIYYVIFFVYLKRGWRKFMI